MIPAYLRSPDLKSLWSETHRRLSRGSAVSSISLRGLTDDQRHALAELLGSERMPPVDTRIPLSRLREALEPLDLEVVLTELVGPVDNARLAQQRAVEERRALWDWLEAHPLLTERPALRTWASRLQSEPIAGAVAKHLLQDTMTVLEALPADRLPLPVLAQRCLGDPHVLDEGRLPNLVLRALAHEAGLPEPADAEAKRRIWETAGVVRDDLSSTVLVAGLAPEGDTFLARILRAARECGEAVPITLAHLKRGPDAFAPAGTVVFVVENPAIMQVALDRFGAAVSPLVCVSGRLHVAARTLLRSLAETGAELRYHGDFDPAGIGIAADVIDSFGARPWRMGEADYSAALGPGPSIDPVAVPETPWDEDLCQSMRREAIAVYEEAVLDDLLADL